MYGRVIHGYDICAKVEQVKTGAQDKPLTPVVIVGCGELTNDEKLTSDNADHLKSYSVIEKEEDTPEDDRVEV